MVEALRAGNPSVFYTEEYPFGGFKHDASAIAAVVAGVGDPDPAIRRVSAEILGNLAVPEATPVLVRGLDDPDAGVRLALLRSLQRAHAAEALLDVTSCLRDSEPGVRQQAILTLRTLAAFPRGLSNYLEPMLADPDAAVASAAAVGLLKGGPHDQALTTLEALARSPAIRDRVQALQAFADCGRDMPWVAQKAFQFAATSLHDPEPLVRQAAARAIARIDPEACVPPLIEALADEADGVRLTVAEVLGSMGAEVALLLAEGLSQPRLAPGALLALEHLPVGPAAWRRDNVVHFIRSYAETQAEAAQTYHTHWQRTLDFLAEPESGTTHGRARLLADALLAKARTQARHALRALGVLWGESRAIALALENLQSANPDQRANALETLDSLASSDVVRPLLQLWEGPSGQDNTGDGSDDTGFRWLMASLGDADDWVRACAALAAAGIAAPNIQSELDRLAQSDPSELVRETAATSLHGGTSMKTLATLSLMERILFLQRVPLFAALSPADLKQVASITGEHYFPDGEIIAHQGETGDEMYIIVSGQVDVMRQPAGPGRSQETREVELAVRQPGEYVGEMAILSERPRMATLIARGDVRALCVEQADFARMLRERPDLSLAVMRELVDRFEDSMPEAGSQA